jgi:multiple sugar transport system ATP-binding protein
LKRVSKIYQDNKLVLDNINLEINEKEFLVIVGPSGCGKTTLLRTIAGLEKPTAGEVFLNGEYANDRTPRTRNVAMVFQEYPLYPNLSVYQNIAFSLKMKRMDMDKIDEKIHKVADLVGVGDLLTTQPKYLSGGQKQRVCLAKSMVREPDFLLLDEPLVNMDQTQRNQLRSEIYRLYETLDIPFIYVTHDQNEALSLGTKVLVMKDGTIQQLDTPKAIYDEPGNLFVASFFSSPKLNILSGTLFNEDGICFRCGEGNQYQIPFSKETYQYLSDYVGKDVLLGIRSDDVRIDPAGPLLGEITHVEFIGDMYVYYLSVKGLPDEIAMKCQMDVLYKTGEVLPLGFDLDEAFLFDAETEETLILNPKTNAINVLYDNGNLVVGSNVIRLSDPFQRTVIDNAKGKNVLLTLPIKNVTIEPGENKLHLTARVDSFTKRKKTNIVYATIAGSVELIIFQANREFDINELVTLYFNERDLFLVDPLGNRLHSSWVISNNQTIADLYSDDQFTYVQIGPTTLKQNKMNLVDGEYQIELDQNGMQVIGKKSTYREIQREFIKANQTNVVIGSAYEEDNLKTKKILFLKMKGFKDYVTAVVDFDFSVYDYPELLLSVSKNAIRIIGNTR